MSDQPSQKPAWDRTKDESYYQSSWRFQRRLVQAFLVPLPFVIAYFFYWRFAARPGYPPLLAWAVLLGSVGFTLASAFFFWRCPACNAILYRTSDSGASLLFWLADPDVCPDCGVTLRPKVRRAATLPQYSDKK